MQIQMDTDTNTDGYRCRYRWIQIQYGWIQIDILFNFIWNPRFDGWIDCYHDSTIQIEKLFNFIWNSRFDGRIDCIHDCIHSTIQIDTDTDGYRHILSKFLDFQDFCYVMLNVVLFGLMD